MQPYRSPSRLDPSAQRIVALTAQAWSVASLSPQALARRAPHGYVPARALRRRHGLAASTALAQSPVRLRGAIENAAVPRADGTLEALASRPVAGRDGFAPPV